MKSWSELVEEISKLHELPTFLPHTFIRGTLAPAIAVVAVLCTVVYMIAFKIVESFAPKGVRVTKVAYQITNVLFNLCIGLVGLYLEYRVLPGLSSYTGTSLDRMPWDHEELYLVSAMQLGYQCWAIPVGILSVGESMEMIFHHIAVVISTCQSGLMTVGFRYYTPFFYGVMELSSLPLSVMNAFKDHPEYIKRYPGGYNVSRVVFAVSFLVIRVLMCFSRWTPFLRDNFVYLYTAEFGYYKLYLTVQWSLAVFLAYLQLYWATLIVKGLFKLVLGNKVPKKED
jgi:hypothetical protein